MIDKKVESYIEEHTSEEDAVLKDLNRITYLKTYYPNMLSGHVQGKFLEMISHMIKPEKILEIGTFTGYSAIALSKGMDSGGQLTTLEVNEELESLIMEFVQKAGLADKIKLIIGNALQLIPTLNDTFDLVFIDADKENYLNYYELVLPKVRQGGFILADNVLWGGKAVQDDVKLDKETRGIKSFNSFIKSDERVEQMMLPLRDGLLLIRKL